MVPEAIASYFTGPARDTGGGGFVEHEKATNKLLRGVCEVEALRDVVLNAVSPDAASSEIDADVHLLVPQSVTLDEVEVTQELVETHLVLLQRKTDDQLNDSVLRLVCIHRLQQIFGSSTHAFRPLAQSFQAKLL